MWRPSWSGGEGSKLETKLEAASWLQGCVDELVGEQASNARLHHPSRIAAGLGLGRLCVTDRTSTNAGGRSSRGGRLLLDGLRGVGRRGSYDVVHLRVSYSYEYVHVVRYSSVRGSFLPGVRLEYARTMMTGPFPGCFQWQSTCTRTYVCCTLNRDSRLDKNWMDV